MHLWHTVLFDLDGTLTDSAQGIAVSAQYALKTLGIDEPDTAKLRCFAGAPLHRQFMEYAHLSEEQADQAVAAFREYYEREGMYLNAVFPGIEQMLYALKRAGKTIGIVTSKEASQAVAVLRQAGIARYFDAVIGVKPEDKNVAKSTQIEQALICLGRQMRRGEVVMVGDRFYDMEGARGAGVASVGVTWGYGGVEELQRSGATALAGDPQMLAQILINGPVQGRYTADRTGAQGAPGAMQRGGSKTWQIMYPLLIWLGVSLLVSSIGGAIYGVYFSAKAVAQNGSVMNPEDAYSIAAQMLQGDGYIFVTNLISLVTDLVLIPIIYAIYKKDVYRRNGFRTSLKKEKKPGAFNAVLAVVMGFSISVVINMIISITGLSGWMYEMNPSRYDTFSNMPLWFEFIIICLLAPAVEELLFRAVIFRRMRTFSSYTTAAFVSAALFGIVHLDVVTGIAAFLIGIVMAMLYEYTGSIFTSMCFHFGFNFYSIAIALLDLESMSDSTAAAVIIGLLIAGAVLTGVTLGLFMKRNKGAAPSYL